jgi:hypothetical protein
MTTGRVLLARVPFSFAAAASLRGGKADEAIQGLRRKNLLRFARDDENGGICTNEYCWYCEMN